MASTDIIGRRALNLRGVKLVEKNALEIIEDCPHVALYRFLTDEARWVRMEIEGSCFVTRNCEAPFYSFLILNKKCEEDLILHVQEDIEKARIQEAYLMLRCKTPQGTLVLGVWIHDDQERTRIFDSLSRILDKKNINNGADFMNKLNNLKLQASAQKPKKQQETPEASSSSYANIVSGLAPVSPIKAATSSSSPVPPPSSTQKTKQLLSLLKATPEPSESSSSSTSPIPSSSTSSAEVPGTSQKRKALLSILKANSDGANDTHGSAEVKEPSTPPSASSQAAANAVTPPPTPPVAPVSAVKSNQLLSFLKNPATPAPEVKGASNTATTPNKTAQLLSLIKKDNNNTAAAVPEVKHQDFLTDSEIAESLRMGAKVLQSAKPVSKAPLPTSESRIEDIIANTAKSRSNSMGDKVEKAAPATADKKKETNDEESAAAASRRERLKHLLISPSMLEG